MKQHEFELLADYVGGALDGTPEAAEVTRKIRDNAAWAKAHSDLLMALAKVDVDLAAAARTDQTMPDDVWSRLEAALGEPPQTSPQPTQAAAAPLWVPPAPAAHPARQEPAKPRRNRWRWLAPVGVAAAVLAVSCFGLNVLRNQVGSQSASDAGAANTMKSTGEAAQLPAGIIELRTGRDYTAATLAVLTDSSVVANATAQAPQLAAGVLSRFSDPAALAGCLEAVQREIPGQATVVDLARYQGSPSIIVVISKADGGKVVGVAGPACGSGGASLTARQSFD